MIEVRRLDPEKDEPLAREALSWLDSQPSWFREIEEKFGTTAPDEFLADMKRGAQADIAIFDGEKMSGLITLVLQAKGFYEAHIRLKRGCDLAGVVAGARMIRHQIFNDLGAQEIFGQIPLINKGAIWLAEMCGLYRDGITLIQGQVRGRLVEWVRLSVSRQQWEAENG